MPTPLPANDRFKEITISWREKGEEKPWTAWFKVLSNGTLLAKLPNYGHYHLHFGLTHPSENTSTLFLQVSDDREPQGTAERRIGLIRIGPISNDDFRRLQELLQTNAELLGSRFFRMFLDSFSWRTFSDLQADGWRSMPTAEELLASDKAHNGRIKIGVDEAKRMLGGPLEKASRALILIGESEAAKVRGVALRSEMKKEDLPKALSDTVNVDSNGKDPAWLRELMPRIEEWVNANANCPGEGPIYLVGDGIRMKAHFEGIAEVILDGAITSFQDIAARDWLAKFKVEALAAMRGEKECDLKGLLGFDLRQVLRDPKRARQFLSPDREGP